MTKRTSFVTGLYDLAAKDVRARLKAAQDAVDLVIPWEGNDQIHQALVNARTEVDRMLLDAARKAVEIYDKALRLTEPPVVQISTDAAEAHQQIVKSLDDELVFGEPDDPPAPQPAPAPAVRAPIQPRGVRPVPPRPGAAPTLAQPPEQAPPVTAAAPPVPPRRPVPPARPATPGPDALDKEIPF